MKLINILPVIFIVSSNASIQKRINKLCELSTENLLCQNFDEERATRILGKKKNCDNVQELTEQQKKVVVQKVNEERDRAAQGNFERPNAVVKFLRI